jgi:hypothetical protein
VCCRDVLQELNGSVMKGLIAEKYKEVPEGNVKVVCCRDFLKEAIDKVTYKPLKPSDTAMCCRELLK